MLTEQQKHITIETIKPYKPTYIGLFGSYARNEEIENSDIDILYDFNPNAKVSLFDLMDLEELLKNKLKKNIDLVSKRFMNKHIKPNIEKDLKTLFIA